MRAERDGIGRRAAYRCMEAVRPFGYHIRLPWLQLFLVALAAHYLCSALHASCHFADYGAVRHRAFRLALPRRLPPLSAPSDVFAASLPPPPPNAPPPSPHPPVRVTVRLLRRGCESLVHAFDAHNSAPLTLRQPVDFDGVELQVSRHFVAGRA